MVTQLGQVVGSKAIPFGFQAIAPGVLPIQAFGAVFGGDKDPLVFRRGSRELMAFQDQLGLILDRLTDPIGPRGRTTLSGFGRPQLEGAFRHAAFTRGDKAAGLDVLRDAGATDQELSQLAQALGVTSLANQVNAQVAAGASPFGITPELDDDLVQLIQGLPAPNAGVPGAPGLTRTVSVLSAPLEGSLTTGVPVPELEQAGGFDLFGGFGFPAAAPSQLEDEVPTAPVPPMPSGSPNTVALLALGGIALLALVIALR